MSVLASSLLVACFAITTRAADGKVMTKARAILTGNSTVRGDLKLAEFTDGTVRITGRITGLSPGKHGFHVHKYGDIFSRGCYSTGPHYNPFNVLLVSWIFKSILWKCNFKLKGTARRFRGLDTQPSPRRFGQRGSRQGWSGQGWHHRQAHHARWAVQCSGQSVGSPLGRRRSRCERRRSRQHNARQLRRSVSVRHHFRDTVINAVISFCIFKPNECLSTVVFTLTYINWVTLLVSWVNVSRCFNDWKDDEKLVIRHVVLSVVLSTSSYS